MCATAGIVVCHGTAMTSNANVMGCQCVFVKVLAVGLSIMFQVDIAQPLFWQQLQSPQQSRCQVWLTSIGPVALQHSDTRAPNLLYSGFMQPNTIPNTKWGTSACRMWHGNQRYSDVVDWLDSQTRSYQERLCGRADGEYASVFQCAPVAVKSHCRAPVFPSLVPNTVCFGSRLRSWTVDSTGLFDYAHHSC